MLEKVDSARDPNYQTGGVMTNRFQTSDGAEEWVRKGGSKNKENGI